MAMTATKQNMAPELRSPSSSDDCGGDLSGEFDARCRISVHYASTPAMPDGGNNGKRDGRGAARKSYNKVAKECFKLSWYQ